MQTIAPIPSRQAAAEATNPPSTALPDQPAKRPYVRPYVRRLNELGDNTEVQSYTMGGASVCTLNGS